MFELKEGKNCWRRSQIDKGGFIVSGQDYFLAFRQALLQAERSVYILAWDIKESIELVREEGYDDGFPLPLNDFIFALLDDRPELEIYILLWDYSMLYIVEREWLPFTTWRKRDQPRLHLETDDAIELGASHHQKVVVIDDSLAFCGGLDLSTWRWDTTDHLAEDPRRTTPKGETYQPFHDVQVVCTGKAAHDLGDLCAYRWKRATGKELPRPASNKTEAGWPSSIPVDIEATEVGIAFTYSAYEEHEAAYQIRQAYLDVIEAARDYIYIENQYLSSHELTEALIKRLQSSEGPEIVMILTKEAGWAEESTMGVLRDRLLEKLIEADSHGRFSAFYPFVEDDSGHQSQVYVHAKVLIADDRTLFIGSANLSNRSMKVDSEVNLVFAYQEPAAEIKQFMHRLVAIHLRCPAEQAAEAISDNNRIKDAIEEIGNNSRHRLNKLEAGTDSAILRKLGDTQMLDPDEPLSPASWMDAVVSDDQKKETNKTAPGTYVVWGSVFIIVVLAAWLIKSLWGEVLDKEQIISLIEGFRNSSTLLPVLVSIFFIGGLIGIPINLLLVASTLAIGPWAAFGCGLIGAVISALAAFWAGRTFAEPLARKIAPESQKKISQRLGRPGIFPVALIRLLPVAPFVVVNLIAGTLKISFPAFLIGTILGMVPGMFAVVWIASQAQHAFFEPQWRHWLILALSVLIVGFLAYALKKLADKNGA
jgi:phospholipase D1/2